MSKDIQRITLLRDTIESLQAYNKPLLDGEICLIDSGSGYDSVVIGDGITSASKLPRVFLNKSGGCEFIGMAVPTTNPNNPTSNIFYIAKDPGKYVNFGDITVAEGEVVILMWRYQSWSKITILDQSLIKTIDEKLKKIEETAIFKIKIGDQELTREEGGIIEIPVDNTLSSTSKNPIQNKTVNEALSWYEGD